MCRVLGMGPSGLCTSRLYSTNRATCPAPPEAWSYSSTSPNFTFKKFLETKSKTKPRERDFIASSIFLSSSSHVLCVADGDTENWNLAHLLLAFVSVFPCTSAWNPADAFIPATASTPSFLGLVFQEMVFDKWDGMFQSTWNHCEVTLDTVLHSVEIKVSNCIWNRRGNVSYINWERNYKYCK